MSDPRPPADADAGAHPAPQLREVASIWWDVDRDPEVRWDVAGRRFDLVDPAAPTSRLRLVELAEVPADPSRVAAALAEGLAACDFPPTEDGVPRRTAARALRAQGVVAALAE